MFTAADALNTVQLDASGITGALHVTDTRATLELFVSSGRLLLYVATASSLEPAGLRSAWTVRGGRPEPVLVAVGTIAPVAELPMICFWHRRRAVQGRLIRLGPFWLAEAVGPRLCLTVDDGARTIIAKTRRTEGPVPLRWQRAGRTPAPFLRFPRHEQESR